MTGSLDRRLTAGLLASGALLATAWILYGRLFGGDDGERAALAAGPSASALPSGSTPPPANSPRVDEPERRGATDAAPAPRLGVTAVEGTVERRRGQVSTPLAVGDLVECADVVYTARGSSVELRHASAGVVVSMAGATRVRLDELSPTDTRLTLEQGRLRATAGKARALAVSASGGDTNARVVDGSFAMQATPGGDVQVFAHDRPVVLRARDERLEVAAGDGAMVAPGQAPRRVPLPRSLLLKVRWPTQRVQREHEIVVAGVTAPGALVEADGASAFADRAGRFSLRVPLREGANRPHLVSEDLAGRRRAAKASGVIRVDSSQPTIQHEGVRFGP